MKAYYQIKGGKKGKYTLRENTYRRTWYVIADYPYFKHMQTEGRNRTTLRETEFGYRIQGPTMQYLRYIEAIESAKKEIPEVYVEDVMSHIVERKQYKEMDGANEKTLKMWVQRFIWQVAHNLGDA